jgi:hypothetical protein
MMMVLLNVNHVLTNVLIVLNHQKTVTLVPKTESLLHIVTVHSNKVTMKFTELLNVQNVTINVLLVPCMKLVSLVPVEELTKPQNAHVHMVGSKTPITNVKFVMSNVKNVPVKPIIVLLVLVTESKNQFVIAQMVSMKMETKSVHNVTNTVFLVLVKLLTVSNVLIPDIYHQSAHLFHNILNLLKSLTSQSVLLLLSLVKPNV